MIAPKLPENNYSTTELIKICGLFKERVEFAQEIITSAKYFFEAPTKYDEKTASKKWKENSATLLIGLSEKINCLETYDANNIEQCFNQYLEEQGVGIGQVMPTLRLALTGEGGGPQIFDIAELLGKQAVLDRIKAAVQILG